MDIVVTDGYAVNPGDLSWDKILSFGDLKVYERTPPDLFLERCHLAEIILTNKVPLTRAIMEQIPALKMISVLATGYNIIDIEAARDKNILVCNVPGYGRDSVAQHTMALLLELSNRVCLHSQSVAAGEWVSSPDWSYAKAPLIELKAKTLGIVGFGNIGQQTARIARSFGMKILFSGPREKNSKLGKFSSLESLFAKSDFISLHCPLTPGNEGFVDKRLLSFMKPGAFLINTARGQLINEHDLSEALDAGILAGAALDVLAKEPPSMENPLLKSMHCIITPHNAWKSKEARQRILDITAKNIRGFMRHLPRNKVS